VYSPESELVECRATGRLLESPETDPSEARPASTKSPVSNLK